MILLSTDINHQTQLHIFDLFFKKKSLHDDNLNAKEQLTLAEKRTARVWICAAFLS